MQKDVDNLPIDIHYNKLLDWLISRRHCQQQWQAASLINREKITAALRDMPATPELTKLLEGAYVNYFHCLALVELLKDTSCGDKNIFGQYSSQKMKEWADIVKRYEKDGVFLAETAQMVARNVNYEIPALKKQMAKCQQFMKDCDKKEVDYARKSTELRHKYSQSCKELGIKGEKIKSELSALVRDLPAVFEQVAESSRDLQKAIVYYQDFTGFLFNGEVEMSDCLPLLRFVLEKGNATTYEWKHKCKPVSVQEADIAIDTKDEEDATGDPEDIDWGDLGDATADDVIDFDISGITLESGGTDEGKGNIDLSVEQLGEEIDWGDTGDSADVLTTPGEGVAVGEEALSVLDNPVTRNLFLDDLMEVEAFLTQRVLELQGEGNVLSVSQFQSAPESVHLDTKLVEVMVTQVRDLIGRFTSVQMQHLMLIRNSPRYVDRLRDSLHQSLVIADKMEYLKKETVGKRGASAQEELELVPKVELLVRKTKEMQKQLEGEISKKYKNRPVNIMGEINTI